MSEKNKEASKKFIPVNSKKHRKLVNVYNKIETVFGLNGLKSSEVFSVILNILANATISFDKETREAFKKALTTGIDETWAEIDKAKKTREQTKDLGISLDFLNN